MLTSNQQSDSIEATAKEYISEQDVDWYPVDQGRSLVERDLHFSDQVSLTFPFLFFSFLSFQFIGCLILLAALETVICVLAFVYKDDVSGRDTDLHAWRESTLFGYRHTRSSVCMYMLTDSQYTKRPKEQLKQLK